MYAVSIRPASAPGCSSMWSVPPGTSTRHCSPPQRSRAAAATATVPVPHERVSPTPRSNTRIRTWPGATNSTNSTFTPSGNRSAENIGARVRSSGSTASTKHTAWGLPTSAGVASKRSPFSSTGVASGSTSTRPMSTRNCPSRSWVTIRSPARVPTSMLVPCASPSSTRNLAKTRTPLPHISDTEPSALR